MRDTAMRKTEQNEAAWKAHAKARAAVWTDPDDAPELTEEWFRKADHYRGEVLVRRGEE